MILFRMMHGAGLFTMGSSTIVKLLEPVHNAAIRAISGAFISSPINSLMVEAGVLPLSHLLCQQMVSKAVRLKEKSSVVQFLDCEWRNRRHQEVREDGGEEESASDEEIVESDMPIYGRTFSEFRKVTGLELPKVCSLMRAGDRAWFISTPRINWSIKNSYKVGEAPEKATSLFRELVRRHYPNHHHIYTDGSVDANDLVSCAATDGEVDHKVRLPEMCSIMSAEAMAILIACERMTKVGEKAVIFSDSAACISAVESGTSRHPWIQSIESIVCERDVSLCWIPGHSGIPGNNRADRLAAEARNEPVLDIGVPANDVIRWAKTRIKWAWEADWQNERQPKLRKVKNTTLPWNDRFNAGEQRILSRLRIGHTRLTHSSILDAEEARCEECDTELTVEHVLVNCMKYDEIRREVGMDGTIRDILANDAEKEGTVLKFLRKANLYKEII